MYTGKCLCGKFIFHIKIESIRAYSCHCLKCRRSSGSAASFTTIVADNNYSMSQGEEFVVKYKSDSGYRKNFCINCGSILPIKIRSYYFIPLGLVTEGCNIEIVIKNCYKDKVNWIVSSDLSLSIDSVAIDELISSIAKKSP